MSWSGTGEAYSASYAGLCAGTGQQVRELAGTAAGLTLLDVGAGDGRLANEWMDAGWRVTACEPERSMRESARRRHPQLQIVEGTLPALPFDDAAFDVVAANFVINHLPDPRAGAKELRRVARDSVIATVWSASPSSFWREVTARSGLPAASGQRLPIDKDFERTAAGFERMLVDAGWRPEVVEFSWVWHPTPTALWRSVVGGVAGAGTYYAGLDEPARTCFRSAFDEVAAERSTDGVIPHTQTAAIAVDRV